MGAKRTKEEDGLTPTLSLMTTNEVHLVGRLSAPAEERTLPSEAVMCTFMVVVDRLDSDVRSRQRVDVLGCVAWKARLRRQVLLWQPGDIVEVRGALRKRFFRTTGGATGSRVEVEVLSARRVKRMAA